MSDQDLSKEGREWFSATRTTLRYVSFTIVLLATIAALLICWRRHFSSEALRASAFTIAVSVYLAIYCYRRSRGWAARLGAARVSPEDDPYEQDFRDKGALVGIVIGIGMVIYAIIRTW
jgi:hypothetical protein